MKAVFIAFNQAHTERVEFILERLDIRGFTWWTEVHGKGSETGEPRMGTHTWPELNSALMTVVADEKVETLLEAVRKLDNINREVGIRAFVWEILQTS
jgi:nitrogen regulatory protein PII